MRLIVVIFLFSCIQTQGQVSAYSESVVTSYNSGIQAFQGNLTTEAKTHFLACIRMEPECFEAYLGLCQIYYSEKNYKEALNYGKKGELLRPFHAELSGMLGKCYHQLDEHDKAETFLKRAISTGNNNVENNICLALSLKKGFDYKGAMHYLSQAIEQNPEDYTIWLERSKLHTLTENYTAAITDLKEAIELAPENGDLHLNLAHNYILIGDNDLAMASIDTGLENATSNQEVPLLLLKGKIHQRKGELDQAQVLYDKAYAIEQNNTAVLIHQSAVLIEFENFAAAVEKCNAALELTPNSMEAYFNRGIAHEMLRDIDGACSDWQKAFVLGSNRAIGYLNGPVCNE